MNRQATIGQRSMISEQFTTIIDLPIPIKIADQQSILGADPACLFGEAITIMIEMDA